MTAHVVLSLFISASLALADADPFARARELYQRTDYEGALRALLAADGRNAGVNQLIGRCYYMQGNPKRASEYFEKAVAAEPGNSQYNLWLGRAYGRRAETSSFITAPGFANKARQSFEKAVQLDSRNLEAISDLFEYYLDAPGFLGGGLDKAAGLANRMRDLDFGEFHWMQARLAEKRKEFQTAENQLRRAAELAPRQVGRVIDLAKFFAKQGRYQESDETFRQARALAPDAPKVIFEQASAYVRAGRNLDAARELLRQYLGSQLTPDDPPRREAEELLKQASSI